jgi:hypothetical protein
MSRKCSVNLAKGGVKVKKNFTVFGVLFMGNLTPANRGFIYF